MRANLDPSMCWWRLRQEGDRVVAIQVEKPIEGDPSYVRAPSEKAAIGMWTNNTKKQG